MCGGNYFGSEERERERERERDNNRRMQKITEHGASYFMPFAKCY
jgi:hypothetical protein